jgi:hypothetical protein
MIETFKNWQRLGLNLTIAKNCFNNTHYVIINKNQYSIFCVVYENYCKLSIGLPNNNFVYKNDSHYLIKDKATIKDVIKQLKLIGINPPIENLITRFF